MKHGRDLKTGQKSRLIISVSETNPTMKHGRDLETESENADMVEFRFTDPYGSRPQLAHHQISAVLFW